MMQKVQKSIILAYFELLKIKRELNLTFFDSRGSFKTFISMLARLIDVSLTLDVIFVDKN